MVIGRHAGALLSALLSLALAGGPAQRAVAGTVTVGTAVDIVGTSDRVLPSHHGSSVCSYRVLPVHHGPGGCHYDNACSECVCHNCPSVVSLTCDGLCSSCWNACGLMNCGPTFRPLDRPPIPTPPIPSRPEPTFFPKRSPRPCEKRFTDCKVCCLITHYRLRGDPVRLDDCNKNCDTAGIKCATPEPYTEPECWPQY
jgi:hypothetical protein